MNVERPLFSRRRRMGDVSVELEHQLFAAVLEDIDRGWLQRYPEHALRSLDALHLTVAAQAGLSMIATADAVMAAAGLSMGFQVARF